jgi:hypothetical protein
MLKSETRLITLTEDELQRRAEQAAHLGAREAVESRGGTIEEFKDEVKHLAITQEIVPEHILLSWLEISSKTLDRWDVPVDSKQGQTKFYHMPTVIAHIRGTHEDEEGGAERKYVFKVTD